MKGKATIAENDELCQQGKPSRTYVYSVTTFTVGGSSGHGMIVPFIIAGQPYTNASKEGVGPTPLLHL